jgi:antitoxin (DNA-binding transcriptional repressor) of toxin-antitoxin stability system
MMTADEARDELERLTMLRMTLEEAKIRLEALVDAALRGEEIVIDLGEERGDYLVQFTAAPPRLPQRGLGSLRGTFTIADNFDDPLDGFADYQ